jgi:hypothetical protein
VYSAQKTLDANKKDLSAGLGEIKIIQEVNGIEKEVNFTKMLTEVFVKSMMNKEQDFKSNSKTLIDNYPIKKIEFPPILEKNIKVKQDFTSEDVKVYLNEVYKLFKKNEVFFVRGDLLKFSTPEERESQAKDLLKKNEAIYYGLFNMEVPQDALSIHKKYIQITQVQNDFLHSILKEKEDPIKSSVALRFGIQVLGMIKDPLNQELKALSKKYQIDTTLSY